MPGFGPYATYPEALLAACPIILSKPHATAGRLGAQNFELRWRLSNEYCGWVYYTPDHQYELSMLTDQAVPDPANRWKNCKLPPFVSDPRYPADSLQYILAIHNHPFEDILSERDIRFIVEMGKLHGFESKTQATTTRLAIIAFFSRSDALESPPCDGFFEYIPFTGALAKWTRAGEKWRKEQLGSVKWINDDTYEIHWN
ncbi:hypothetical protein [Hyalangium gracile]|uniref:hypothetical protein n=1 Tax=Hyalangium gracile TaxID=394092 RepID=UPI001CCF3DE2|nr:hypothetical protein [Hyalangium gracile]